MKMSGKPDAGNPPVRFDEGDQRQLWSLLYRPEILGWSATGRRLLAWWNLLWKIAKQVPRSLEISANPY